MILATFTWNEKEYVYYIENNKILYGYIENGEIHKEINEEEKQFMNKLYRKMICSSNVHNYKNCGTLNYNGKKFQIMYDPVSCKKTFYEVLENEYKIPTYEDFVYLDRKLNPEAFYSNIINDLVKEYKQNKSMYKTVLVYGVAVLLNLSGLYQIYYPYFSANNAYVVEDTEEKEEGIPYSAKKYVIADATSLTNTTIAEDTNLPNITIADLQEALDNNKNLSAAEKQCIASDFPMLEENIDYVDMQKAKDRLSDITFSYHLEDCPRNTEFSHIYGEYNSTNTIIIYNCNSFAEAIEKDLDILSHEKAHIYTANFDFSLAYKVYEAMNEIVSMEYIKSDSRCYSLERPVVYLLIELLGKDVLREFYFKDDPQILLDSLMEIIDDEEKAYLLLGSIDNLSIEYEEKMSLLSETTERDIDTIKASMYDPINSLIGEYYEAKYGYPMLENEVMENYIYIQAPLARKEPKFIEESIQSFKDETQAGIIVFDLDFILPYYSSELIQKKSIDGSPKQSVCFPYVKENGDFYTYYLDDDKNILSR